MGHVEFQAYKTACCVDILVHGKQHLDTHETQDDTEAVLQVAKVLGNSGQREIECPESEDGEDVRGEHNKGVAADGEDGRDAVDSKGHIGGLND